MINFHWHTTVKTVYNKSRTSDKKKYVQVYKLILITRPRNSSQMVENMYFNVEVMSSNLGHVFSIMKLHDLLISY